MATKSTKTAAPQAKTKTAEAVERGFFSSAYEDARVKYTELMTIDEGTISAKRVLCAFVIGFVASCAVMYFAIPYIMVLMLMAELFTGYGFIGFMVGVIALIFTWWASAKLGGFVADIVNARVVERGAIKLWDSITGLLPAKAVA
jgi:hypothetical protein